MVGLTIKYPRGSNPPASRPPLVLEHVTILNSKKGLTTYIFRGRTYVLETKRILALRPQAGHTIYTPSTRDLAKETVK